MRRPSFVWEGVRRLGKIENRFDIILSVSWGVEGNDEQKLKEGGHSSFRLPSPLQSESPAPRPLALADRSNSLYCVLWGPGLNPPRSVPHLITGAEGAWRGRPFRPQPRVLDAFLRIQWPSDLGRRAGGSSPSVPGGYRGCLRVDPLVCSPPRSEGVSDLAQQIGTDRREKDPLRGTPAVHCQHGIRWLVGFGPDHWERMGEAQLSSPPVAGGAIAGAPALGGARSWINAPDDEVDELGAPVAHQQAALVVLPLVLLAPGPGRGNPPVSGESSDGLGQAAWPATGAPPYFLADDTGDPRRATGVRSPGRPPTPPHPEGGGFLWARGPGRPQELGEVGEARLEVRRRVVVDVVDHLRTAKTWPRRGIRAQRGRLWETEVPTAPQQPLQTRVGLRVGFTTGVEAGGGGVPPDWKGGGTCWQALRPDSGTPRAFVSRLKSSWKFAGRGAAPAIVKS